MQLFFDSTGSSFVGQELSIDFFSSRDQTAFDNIQLSVTSVPEPSTFMLFSVGIVVSAVWRTRSRSGRTKR
ncbi:MAG: PEP-CTERM sorting domain-containing protein [Pirellulaceae bacterium]